MFVSAVARRRRSMSLPYNILWCCPRRDRSSILSFRARYEERKNGFGEL